MKYKFILNFLVCFLFQSYCFAQFTLQFNAINEYSFNTREALNITAINPATKSIEVEFRGKITSADGQTVVEFKSNPVLVNPGANVFNSMNCGIREQIYFNQDIAEIETKTGTYPSGNYSICIMSTCVVQDCNGVGQYAGSVELPVCVQIHIENPTPLLLAFPENESELEETRPLYTWIPPGPVASSASLNYTIIVVEIIEGQNKSDALALNRPLIEMVAIGNPLLMHPSDISSLEAGKTYAWQVEAFIGRTSLGKSEQWKFKVKKEPKSQDSTMYAVVTKNIDAGAVKVSSNGKLYFLFTVNRPNYTLAYEILRTDYKLVFSKVNQIVYDIVESKEQTIGDLQIMGPGKFVITISDLKLPSGFYYLHLISPDKEDYYLKFYLD